MSKRPPPLPTSNRFDAYPPGATNPLTALGRRGKPKSNPKSSPGFPDPEPATRPNSPAARAARLVSAWAKLSPARMSLVEEIVAELEKQ